jgi:hypothetical protein
MRRHITPLEHVADIKALRIQIGVNVEVERQGTDLDLRTMRQSRGVREHASLMRRVLVEHIDTDAHHIVRVKSRPEFAKMLNILCEQLSSRLIGICHLEVTVDEHHGARDPL